MMTVFSNGMQLPLLKHRSYVKTTSGTPGTATQLTIGSITASTDTYSGTTATFTATGAHRLADGQEVTISGANQSAYNGKFKITVTSGTAFTYTMLSNPGTNSTGTVVATYTPHAQWALLVAASGNTDNVSFGPDVNADLDIIRPGESYVIPVPNGAKFNLADWYIKSASASQGLTVLFV